MAMIPMEFEDNSDYTTLSLNSGYTGQVRIARRGNIVSLLLYINGGLTAGGTTYENVCTGSNALPEEYRIKVGNAYFPLGSTANSAGLVLINNSGEIKCHSASSSGYAIITYFV